MHDYKHVFSHTNGVQWPNAQYAIDGRSICTHLDKPMRFAHGYVPLISFIRSSQIFASSFLFPPQMALQCKIVYYTPPKKDRKGASHAGKETFYST